MNQGALSGIGQASGIVQPQVMVPLFCPPPRANLQWFTNPNTAMWFGMWGLNSLTPPDGSWGEWDVILAPGSYRLDLYHSQGTNHGIMELFYDDFRIMRRDNYNAAAATVWSHSIAPGGSITALLVAGGSAPSLHRLRVAVNGKNASSTGFFVPVSAAVFTKMDRDRFS